MNETSPIYVFGRGSDVIVASQLLQIEVEKMVIRTISLNKEVTKFIFDNIKEVKSHADPCEIRVKRPNFKDKPTEIKHPFFFVPNFAQEICLLGTEEEVAKG